MPEARKSFSPARPEIFGRYVVEAEIGDGAMGRVYRGFDPLVRRLVAIKTVKSEHLTKSTAEDYLHRFRREAQAAGGLSHPNIVAIYDVGEDYFVMEFLEGTSLEALLHQRGALEVPEALRLFAPVADALAYAHKRGIVHRDIKPANIMVLPDGRPKLTDFGVAHLESSVMTRAGEILGSPSYMAPEQIAGGEVTAAADVFSLAVVIYEAITGQRPFQGDSLTTIIYRVVHENPPPPRNWNAQLPTHYDEVFARALSKSPADRYPSAPAFLAALDLKEFDVAFTAATSVPVPDPAPATLQAHAKTLTAEETLTRPATRWRVPLFAAAAALVALGAFAVLRRPAPAPAPVAEAPPRTESRAAAKAPSAPRAARKPEPVPARPREGDLVAMGPDVTPPRRVSGDAASYPALAIRAHLQGSVTVDFVVTEQGEPTEIRVVQSAGEILDRAVVNAVKKWRFEPARKAGVKVRVHYQTRQQFKLN